MTTMTAWERMHKRKKELGFTVMIFRNNYLFENWEHGVQVDFPRHSKIMTEEEADEVIQALEEVIAEHPNKVNPPKRRGKWWY